MQLPVYKWLTAVNWKQSAVRLCSTNFEKMSIGYRNQWISWHIQQQAWKCTYKTEAQYPGKGNDNFQIQLEQQHYKQQLQQTDNTII